MVCIWVCCWVDRKIGTNAAAHCQHAATDARQESRGHGDIALHCSFVSRQHSFCFSCQLYLHASNIYVNTLTPRPACRPALCLSTTTSSSPSPCRCLRYVPTHLDDVPVAGAVPRRLPVVLDHTHTVGDDNARVKATTTTHLSTHRRYETHQAAERQQVGIRRVTVSACTRCRVWRCGITILHASHSSNTSVRLQHKCAQCQPPSCAPVADGVADHSSTEADAS